MSQLIPDILNNRSGWRGELIGPETWWAAQQEALEHAGYMLQTRYRPGWKPSWSGTDKDYFNTEDGQSQPVSFCASALHACAHEITAARVHGRNSDL